MFLTKVDISKTAYFMTTQTFSQEVTKFIPCDDVTRFDGMKQNNHFDLAAITTSVMATLANTSKITQK